LCRRSRSLSLERKIPETTLLRKLSRSIRTSSRRARSECMSKRVIASTGNHRHTPCPKCPWRRRKPWTCAQCHELSVLFCDAEWNRSVLRCLQTRAHIASMRQQLSASASSLGSLLSRSHLILHCFIGNAGLTDCGYACGRCMCSCVQSSCYSANVLEFAWTRSILGTRVRFCSLASGAREISHATSDSRLDLRHG
jgi:hypothetical protein